MPAVKCKGVNIEFPFEPYDCQHDYMSKVVECLQSGSNGILESPTGTGKTLCLLCAALAWRRAYIAQQELGRCLQGAGGGGGEGEPQAQGGAEGGFRQALAAELKQGAGGSWGDAQEGTFVDRPRIIYASRTHSQLSQAVNQLKDTAYRPRVAVIGSREQLCIHPEVQKADSNTAKVHMCKAKVNNRICHFYNNLDQKKADKTFTDNILDIEDLAKLGNAHKVCPYYMARELKANADIVFMPYNYLLDAKSRRIHGVELQGNVVIFDEAHNVEKMCEESSSFDLSSFDLASCVEEVDNLLSKTIEVESCNQQFRSDAAAEESFDASALATLKKLFLDLETELDHFNPPEAGLTKPGSFIYEFLAKVHITFDSKVEILQLLDKIISHLTTSSTVFHNKAAGLQKFSDILNTIFSKDSPSATVTEASRCYKVHIRASAPQKKGRSDLWTSGGNAAKKKKQGYTLNFWCFSPGASMKELVAQGVRSVILTSGTLSPLSSFKSELQIDFPIQLENPHVISKHQMTVAVMTKGPDGTVLNSSYNTRFNTDYVMSLGNAIVNFSRLVPNGLLVFFPSYPVMNHCLEQWQTAGIHARISQYKEIFVEPRGKVNFVETIEAYYEKINDPKLNGACFFAVCRGKVSEGLDFADINGRAVVITGLPFPPRMDPRIVLKMQYLDETKRRNPKSLSGQDWYRQQASRAVNQAIGRVIRHKQDFGAILLCDTRFSNRDARNQLPAWVRPYTNVYEQFGKGVRDLTKFFKETEKRMPKPQPKLAKPSGPVPIDRAHCRPLPNSSSSSSATMMSAGPTTKAKYVDAHVPSLKRNRDGSHVSEAQLKIMYEDTRTKPVKRATGLLDALSNEENVQDSRASSIFSQHSSLLKGQQSGQLQQSDKTKRKRIVIKQPTVSQPPLNQKVQTRLGTAQEYIAKVKETLSSESYKKFSEVMQEYKKTDNFMAMLTGISELFTQDEANYPLFRNFYTFARPHHKQHFNRVCLTMTGQGCGYKPEHSVPPKKVARDSREVRAVGRRPHEASAAPSKPAGPVKSGQIASTVSSSHQGATTSKAGNPTKGDASTSVGGSTYTEEVTRAASTLFNGGVKGQRTAPPAGEPITQGGQQSAAARSCRESTDDNPEVVRAPGKSGGSSSSAKTSSQATPPVRPSEEPSPFCGTSWRVGCSGEYVDEPGISVKPSGEAGFSATVPGEPGHSDRIAGEEGSSAKTSKEVRKPVKMSTSSEGHDFPKASINDGPFVETFAGAGSPRKASSKEGTLGTKPNMPSSSLQRSDREPESSVQAFSKSAPSLKTSGEPGLSLKISSEVGTSVKTSRRPSSDFRPTLEVLGEAGKSVKPSGEALPSTKSSASEGTSLHSVTTTEDCPVGKATNKVKTFGGDPEDSPSEGEEEPMSLESSADDCDVLDASRELFDDSISEAAESLRRSYPETDPIEKTDKGTGAPSVDIPISARSQAVQGGHGLASDGDQAAGAPAPGALGMQGTKRLRIQKMIKHVKRSIGDRSACEEDKERMTEEKTGAKELVDRGGFDCRSRPDSKAERSGTTGRSKRHPDKAKFMEVEQLSQKVLESPSRSGFKKSSKVTLEKEQRSAASPKEDRVGSRFEIDRDEGLIPKEVQILEETTAVGNVMPRPALSKEPNCMDSPRRNSGADRRDPPPTKNTKSKSAPTGRSSSATPGVRKRQADGSPEVSSARKAAKTEVRAAATAKDPAIPAVPGRDLRGAAQGSESGSPRRKKEGETAECRPHTLLRSPRGKTFKKAELVDVARQASFSLSSPSPSKQDRSTKKAATKSDASPWLSKQSSIEKSASHKHRKKTSGDCALCKKKAWPAYRGPCGHVCCQTCWQEYIREFQECPGCGAETKEQQLTAV